jgi:chemotaxis protein MotB
MAAARTIPGDTEASPGGALTALAGSQLDGTRVPTAAELRAERERQEKAAFEQAAQQIRDAVQNDPALAELAKQLAIDMTPEGLRIQIMDEIRQPMFASGSAAPNDRARLLLQKVVPVLLKLPQSISIAGHTDAAPFPGPGRTNWELSAERANATRRLLVDGGFPEGRVRSVTGHADRDPLLPADPLAAANRRIAIVVLREASSLPVPAHP